MRLGGKIKTCQFAGVGPYEAGAAEIYDYSRLGPDPLHDLIVKELGLQIKYISGGPCVLDGKIMVETDDLAKPSESGPATKLCLFASAVRICSIPKTTTSRWRKRTTPTRGSKFQATFCSRENSPTTSRVATSGPWRTATSPPTLT